MANFQHCGLSIWTDVKEDDFIRKLFYELSSEIDPLDFSKIVPEPEFEDMGDQFNAQRLDWIVANWGCDRGRTNEVNFDFDKVHYRFDTKWTAPYIVVLMLIKKYPNLHISFSSQEEINMDLLSIEHHPGELVHAEYGVHLCREDISGAVMKVADFPIDGDIVQNFERAIDDGNNKRRLIRLDQDICGCKNYQQREWDQNTIDPISGKKMLSPGDLVIDCLGDDIRLYYSSSTPRKNEEQIVEFT